MAQLDALQLSEKIRQRLTDFCVDNNFVRDPQLVDICRALWSSMPQDGGLLSDIWVEGNFPAKQSDWTLAKLVDARRFDAQLLNQLDKTGAVPSERPLYTHQYEALCCAENLVKQPKKPTVVVTAGTGAGKTEAFLLPILNALYTSPIKQDGVKCIILYPMNALVNDQVDRLYSWLEGQTHVRLFHFTSETPENKKFADRDGIPYWDHCRVRTRQEARGLENPKTGRKQAPPNLDQVPDILVTNYSMLEYMLCRPQDSVFFGPGLRAVVLDEAHLYTGTLAAEIALLLRRLAIRCGVSPSDILQMATSATLGSGNVSDLKRFAATIFSKSIDQVQVIEGRSTRIQLDTPAPPKLKVMPEDLIKQDWLNRPLMTYDEDMQPILAKEPDMCQQLRQKLQVLVHSTLVNRTKEQDVPARLLKETLGAAPLIHVLEEELYEKKHLPLTELAETLWGGHEIDEVKATIVLLQLAATARAKHDQYPLVPHRIHLIARSNDELFICVNSHCSGEQHLKLNALGRVFSGFHESCPSCRGAVLSLFRCRNCGEWLLAGRRDQQYLKPAISDESNDSLLFSLQEIQNGKKYGMDPITAELGGTSDNAVFLYKISECPRCSESQQALTAFRWSRLILSILAETILSEMPRFPTLSNGYLPAQGRRLLVFSDSRQEAARLGPRLTSQHELQVIRAAILKQIAEEPLGGERTIAEIEKQIKHFEIELAKPDLPLGSRRVFEGVLQDLRSRAQSAAAGGSIDDWCKELSRQSLLYELLDRETAWRHVPKKDEERWGQREWEENYNQVKRHIKSYLAHEFARAYRGDNSLANLGLVEVTYPGINKLEVPNALLGTLPHEKIRTQLSQVWADFLKALCDTLRSDGVIVPEDSDVLENSPFDLPYIGYWCAEKTTGNRLVSFVGQSLRQRRLWFTVQVLRACGVSDKVEELADQVLREAFSQLMIAAHPAGQKPSDGQLPWLQHSTRQSGTGPTQNAIQLVFDYLGLRRPVEIYRCEKTGHLWYRSILGCAPEFGCDRTLSSKNTSDEELDKDARFGRQRREYRNSKVFQMGLWAEEHSAQLSPPENRRLQDLFKYGIRNILSATTTLELGIDIGGLNAVLMSNVPPGKANYLQRAGRAGRRSDGSSAVITYARPQPYDREVFNRIGDYLDRPLRKPLVFLDRNRVVKRHFHAFLVGEFFRSIYPEDQHVGAMDAFGNMGTFCGVPKVAYWKKGDPKPSIQKPKLEDQLDFPWWNPDLKESGLQKQFLSYLEWIRDRGQEILANKIETLLNETQLLKELEDWHRFLQCSIDHFSKAVRSWREEYENLLLGWDATKEEQRAQANAIRYQLHALYEITVIEGLADRQFLPRYGFPIGVQKLRVIAPDQEYKNKKREEDQYRLERSSLLALREYVPGSQLLAGGKLISSRGLLKHWTGADIDASFGLRGRWCKCVNDHFYYWITKVEEVCPICGAKPDRSPEQILFPRHGFTSAAWDPPKFNTSVERVGNVETVTMTFLQNQDEGTTPIKDFGNIQGLVCRYQEDGEILVYNNGEKDQGFAVCLKCGFAESETEYGDGIQNLSSDFVNHAPLYSSNPWTRCWPDGESPVLRRQMLAAREITDVLMIDFVNCPDFQTQDCALITTLGYALQRAGVQILELDMREIGLMTVPAGKDGSGWSVVLYDNVSGGAGHVRELLSLDRLWLEEALRVLYVESNHHQRCETACLDCLLGIDTQIAVSRGLLRRRQAHSALDLLLKGTSSPQPDNAANQEKRCSGVSEKDSKKNARYLLQKAQDRLKKRR